MKDMILCPGCGRPQELTTAQPLGKERRIAEHNTWWATYQGVDSSREIGLMEFTCPWSGISGIFHGRGYQEDQ